MSLYSEIGNRIVHGKEKNLNVTYTNYNSKSGKFIQNREFNNEKELNEWVDKNKLRKNIEIHSMSKDARKSINENLKSPKFKDHIVSFFTGESYAEKIAKIEQEKTFSKLEL